MRKILYILTLVSLLACQDNSKRTIITEDGKKISYIQIVMQPYNDFTKKEVMQLRSIIQPKLKEILKIDSVDIEIADNKKIPDSLKSKTRNRYRAKKIIDYQKINGKIIFGLLHQDISATAHGVDDYGICGYAYMPGTTCVASDFRLSDKRNLWKIVIHEFLHSRGLPHCPDDNPECIMKDAKGHGNFAVIKDLCPICRESLLQKRKKYRAVVFGDL